MQFNMYLNNITMTYLRLGEIIGNSSSSDSSRASGVEAKQLGETSVRVRARVGVGVRVRARVGVRVRV